MENTTNAKEITVELNMFQRINLRKALPVDTNWIEFCIKRSINEKIEVTEDELKKCGLTIGDQIDPAIVPVISEMTKKEITFSELETAMITKQLTALEKASKLNNQTGPLYEKFCMQKTA